MATWQARTDVHLNEVIREIFWLELMFRGHIFLVHIPGTKNQIADALSRNKMDDFKKFWNQYTEIGIGGEMKFR